MERFVERHHAYSPLLLDADTRLMHAIGLCRRAIEQRPVASGRSAVVIEPRARETCIQRHVSDVHRSSIARLVARYQLLRSNQNLRSTIRHFAFELPALRNATACSSLREHPQGIA